MMQNLSTKFTKTAYVTLEDTRTQKFHMEVYIPRRTLSILFRAPAITDCRLSVEGVVGKWAVNLARKRVCKKVCLSPGLPVW